MTAHFLAPALTTPELGPADSLDSATATWQQPKHLLAISQPANLASSRPAPEAGSTSPFSKECRMMTGSEAAPVAAQRSGLPPHSRLKDDAAADAAPALDAPAAAPAPAPATAIPELGHADSPGSVAHGKTAANLARSYHPAPEAGSRRCPSSATTTPPSTATLTP